MQRPVRPARLNQLALGFIIIARGMRLIPEPGAGRLVVHFRCVRRFSHRRS